jgi:glutamate synthase (NADPH/NADH) large chain
VGFVAHIKGQKAHAIVEQGLKILENLDHRGAVGADKLMGDGAGILIQIPDDFYRAEMAAHGKGVQLPPPGEYGVGMIFLPKEHASRAWPANKNWNAPSRPKARCCWAGATCRWTAHAHVPAVRAKEPVIRQIFIGRGPT